MGEREGHPRRRALLIGGGAAALAAGGAALAGRDELTRWWWRAPWAHRDRRPGRTDTPGAHWVPATEANYREANRPWDWQVDRVVIHVTQASFEVTQKIFRDPAQEVSAHYVVRSRDGRVAQMVREMDVAYHAGGVSWNNRSIGIEHEGWVDKPQYFTDAMYRSSAGVTAAVCRRYGIPADRTHIIGHSEVPVTDHTDPGKHWDWERYLRYVTAAHRG